MRAFPPIVDAHHHLWDLSRFPYPWLHPSAPHRPFGDHTAIKRDYPIEAYLEDVASPLRASVHVQANSGAVDPVAETAWIAQEAERTGRQVAIIGPADPADVDLPRTIDRHADFAGFRGLRLFAGWDASPIWSQTKDPQLLRSEPILRLATDLCERELSLDLVVFPAQLPQLAELVQRVPGLRIAVNHLGMPRAGHAGEEAQWRAGVRALSPFANVFFKISGLWTIDRDWRHEAIGPYVQHVVASLGADRCMYGSNLPIEKLMTPMASQLAQLQAALPDLSEQDRHMLFGGTATNFYRLRETA